MSAVKVVAEGDIWSSVVPYANSPSSSAVVISIFACVIITSIIATI